jgi:hypothetical protein
VSTRRLLLFVKDSVKLTPEEIEKYYQAHTKDYRQGTAVQRIIVPLHSGSLRLSWQR